MSNNADPSPNSSQIVEVSEDIYTALQEIFGPDSSEDGLLAVRQTVLHQFSVLASTFHHGNAIDFVRNGAEISKIFDEELKTANYRTKSYKEKAFKLLIKKVEELEEYREAMLELENEINHIRNLSEHYLDRVKHSYYQNILQSLNFYLQEIKSRILEPAYQILNSEINAAHKIIDLAYIREENPKNEDISREEMARMCEVLSWGLEIEPGWQSIQNESDELFNNLQKKLGSLKAMVTTFYNS